MHRQSILALALAGIFAATPGCDDSAPTEGPAPGGESPATPETPLGTATLHLDTYEELPDAEYQPGDWAVWRGPHGNGIADANSDVPVSWSETENIVWKTPVPGRGHASPTVVGGKVVLATADEKTLTQSVVVFQKDDGEQVWKADIHKGGFTPPDQMHLKSTHANGTVASDGERLIVAFLNAGRIHATALDLAGNQLWQTDLGRFLPRYGYAPSPTIYKSLMIFAADNWGGGFLVAVHRGSGKIVWRAERPAVSTYSSPIVATVAGRDQLLISGCNHVVSYEPLTGKEIWKTRATSEATCGTIVWDKNHVFASGGFPERQTVCIKADGSGEIVWQNSTSNYEQSLLVHDGAVYLVNDGGIAFCFDAATGQEKWKHRLSGYFSASPILVGNLIYATNEHGETFVFEADPDEFHLTATNRLGDESFATPTISGGRIYHRVADRMSGSRQDFLYCIGHSAGDAKSSN